MEDSWGMGHAYQYGISKNCQLYASEKLDRCDGIGGYQEHTHSGTSLKSEGKDRSLFTWKLLDDYLDGNWEKNIKLSLVFLFLLLCNLCQVIMRGVGRSNFTVSKVSFFTRSKVLFSEDGIIFEFSLDWKF